MEVLSIFLTTKEKKPADFAVLDNIMLVMYKDGDIVLYHLPGTIDQ